MAKENKKEISFVEGPIFQSLIRFALPVLGALILQAAYGAVDLLVVGWFGDASSISAVGTGSNFMQMVTLYHHQPCDGFDRYDRPAHRRGQAG